MSLSAVNSDTSSQIFIGNLPATDEQAVIIRAAQTGESFKVSAFAGASKTTVLNGIAQHLPFKQILYLAFNKAIADEARMIFPNWVDCRTAHSLAYRYMVNSSDNYRQKLQAGANFIPYQAIEKFSEQPDNWRPFGRSRFQVNIAISETLNNFLNSSDPKVGVWHIPETVMSWPKGSSSQQADLFFSQLASYTQNLAVAMLDENSACPMNHDAYLKAFQLRQPKLKYDVILLDEAQDTNPVLQAIILQQDCQKILVGDKHQEIYSWRGAYNSLEKTQLKEYPLTKSFRFGEHIAASANKLLAKLQEPRKVVGLGQDVPINEQFNPNLPYAVMCRTNAKVFEVAEFCLSRKISYHINGGLQEITRLIGAAHGLYAKDFKAPKSPELSLFNTWEEFKDISDELGKTEWKNIIKFVETHKDKSLQRIEQLGRQQVQEPQNCMVFISTVHKAKGLGFDQVVLASDYEWPEAQSSNYREDLNVIYVAITRAQRVLLLPKNLRPHLTTRPGSDEKPAG